VVPYPVQRSCLDLWGDGISRADVSAPTLRPNPCRSNVQRPKSPTSFVFSLTDLHFKSSSRSPKLNILPTIPMCTLNLMRDWDQAYQAAQQCMCVFVRESIRVLPWLAADSRKHTDSTAVQLIALTRSHYLKVQRLVELAAVFWTEAQLEGDFTLCRDHPPVSPTQSHAATHEQLQALADNSVTNSWNHSKAISCALTFSSAHGAYYSNH